MSGRDHSGLLEVLEEARTLGLLGPGPIEPHQEHAVALGRAVGAFDGDFLDLGSGGGLPGLVLAQEWPRARAVLLDAQRRRCDFLEGAVATLDLSARVRVECGRAEVLAHEARLRGQFDLVVARSFGRPAATAECAIGFLRTGGALVVTEPPEDVVAEGSRWDPEGLATLGFGAPEHLRVAATGAVRMVVEAAPDERWPRRDGVPGKRPLW